MRTNKVFINTYQDKLINNSIEEYSKKKSINIFFKIPKLIENKEIHQVRIVPDKRGEYYIIEFSYKDDEYEVKPMDDKIMGIDLGVTNLASCVMYNNESFIIDGKVLLSKIQLTSKRLAKLQSDLPSVIYTSKGIEYGINIIEINESYTSVSSFYDNDEIGKDKIRSGKRIQRGLYKRKDGTIINADINAALNMINKYKRNSNDTVIKYLMSRGLTIPYRVYVNM